jgi:RNA recognition motif-containing protein
LTYYLLLLVEASINRFTGEKQQTQMQSPTIEKTDDGDGVQNDITVNPITTNEHRDHDSSDIGMKLKESNSSSTNCSFTDQDVKTNGNSSSTSSSSSSEDEEEPHCKDGHNTNNTLFVHGLSLHTNEEELRELFAKHGKVRNVNVVRDPRTHINRGFGFVTMSNLKGTLEALEKMNGMAVKGAQITVQRARRNKPRDSTPGEYKGSKPKPRVKPPHYHTHHPPYSYVKPPPYRAPYLDSRFYCPYTIPRSSSEDARAPYPYYNSGYYHPYGPTSTSYPHRHPSDQYSVNRRR